MRRVTTCPLIFHLLIVVVFSVDPPIWPVKFSQSMNVDFGDLVTTGKYWYDSTYGA